MRLIELDKTRKTPFHLQSNAVTEIVNETLKVFLAECVFGEQSNWSQQWPYVMMAYRSSVHESTGDTLQLFILGQGLSLPLDCMYPNPQENATTHILEFVHNKEPAFQRDFELVRRNLKEKKRRIAICSKKKVHRPTYTPNVAFRIEEETSSKEQFVHYDRRKPTNVTFRIKLKNSSKQKFVHYRRLKPPSTSNLPTGDKPRNFQSTRDIADIPKHKDGTLNHDDFLNFLPALSSVFTPIPVVG